MLHLVLVRVRGGKLRRKNRVISSIGICVRRHLVTSGARRRHGSVNVTTLVTHRFLFPVTTKRNNGRARTLVRRVQLSWIF